MTQPDSVHLPRWGKVAIVLAAILLIIVVATSVDFSSDDDAPDRPNLIGFDTTTR
jgi:hypothetical protein